MEFPRKRVSGGVAGDARAVTSSLLIVAGQMGGSHAFVVVSCDLLKINHL